MPLIVKYHNDKSVLAKQTNKHFKNSPTLKKIICIHGFKKKIFHIVYIYTKYYISNQNISLLIQNY